MVFGMLEEKAFGGQSGKLLCLLIFGDDVLLVQN